MQTVTQQMHAIPGKQMQDHTQECELSGIHCNITAQSTLAGVPSGTTLYSHILKFYWTTDVGTFTLTVGVTLGLLALAWPFNIPDC